MTSKMKVLFELNVNQGSRIKLVTMHPLKSWIGIINQNNTFSLWNFEEKILIKSFSCNTLDDNKLVQIKEIVFFDKHSLCLSEVSKNMKNNIIFVTGTKLFFYDYVTDVIKQINEKQFEQKIIRKVCVYSQDKICIAMGDGSFKVLDSRELYNKNAMSVRTVRGYHTKPISWIFSYSQNYNELPRVITASGQDGLMACWNVDMILKTPSNVEIAAPCFKFTAFNKQKGKQIANQQILSLQYEPSSYRLITVSENYIRLWSTMTGIEVKRIKNAYKYREVIFFNHFSYATESFIAHSNTSRLMVVRNCNGTLYINDQIEIKSFFPNLLQNPQEQLSLQLIKSLPHHPSNLYIVTNYNMIILEVDKCYRPSFGIHPSFTTRLSTINSRDFVTKVDGEIQIRNNISQSEIQNIKFQEDILINTFSLSFESDWIYFNLIEVQESTMLNECRKYKMHRIHEMSCFKNNEGGRTITMVNFDGSEIILFNKAISYYEVYASDNSYITGDDLLGGSDHENINRVDFYSRLKMEGSGYAHDIIWHQYKNQFAIIAGFDANQKLVEFRAVKQKKGFFKGKEEQVKYSLSAEPKTFRTCVYQKKNSQYVKIEQSEPFKSNNYRLFNFGSFYGYNVLKGTFQLLQFMLGDKSTARELEGILNTPDQVYSSYCESYYILSYDKYFIIYKAQQNGSMSYFRTLEYMVLHGYFWEKYFFFLSDQSLYFLHILDEDVIVIKVATASNHSSIEKVIFSIEDDDFQPECRLLPAGQQQIACIINMHVMLFNQSGNTTLISLECFPYIVFCLQVASGILDKSERIYKRASKNIMTLMKKTLANYGMITLDLFS